MTTPHVGEVWWTAGVSPSEGVQRVRVMEILPSGNIDVNYELDPTLPEDLRIVHPSALLKRYEET